MSKSKDLREAAVKYRLSNHTLEETAEVFGVSKSAVSSWVQKYKETGDLSNKPLNRGFKKIDPEKVKKYLEETENIPEDEIVYVDETGIDTCLYREYGYAPRGEKVQAEISGKKFQRTNIVAGQMSKKIISPMQYSGTTDSELFEFWFEHCLLSCVSEGQVIVMDNAPFHRKEELSEIAKKYKCRVIFLPPYSPEFSLSNFSANSVSSVSLMDFCKSCSLAATSVFNLSS